MSHSNGNGHSNGLLARTDLGLSIDRLPPQNLDAERGVLGSILLGGTTTLDEIVSGLAADDFYRDTHQTIYRAMLTLYADGGRVDALTVANQLEAADEFRRVGGDDALLQFVESAPVVANAPYYAAIVREKAIMRAIIEAANGMLRDGYSGDLSSGQALQRAERAIFDLATRQTTGNLRSIGEILPGVIEAIERRKDGEVTGVSSGFPDLDFIAGGFQPGQLIVLAARPSHGKSALAWSIAEHTAVDAKVKMPVLFASLEMTGESLVERALSARSLVDGHKLRTGYALSAVDCHKLGKAYTDLKPAPIYIDDTPAQTMLHAMSTARRVRLRAGLGLYVFDYAQLGEPEDPRESRQEQVAVISRRLKAMARELQIPVIALSQLNRKVEERPDHQPMLSDLRESGAIEQDADIVILLHRPEFYDPNDQPGIAVANVAKNRNGATGRVKLVFQKHCVRFDSLSRIVDPVDVGPEF